MYGVPQQGARFGALDGHLHFTFMQMIGFDVYPGLALPADYGNVAHVDNSMTRIYDEMEAREATAIAEHGLKHDPTLRGEQAQRCLAAYTLCTYDNFHAFASLDLLMGRLQEAYGDDHVLCRLRPDRNHVLFGHLHMTFMQLLGFDIYGTVDLPKDYGDVLESVLLRVLRPFEVHFTGPSRAPACCWSATPPSASTTCASRRETRSPGLVTRCTSRAKTTSRT